MTSRILPSAVVAVFAFTGTPLFAVDLDGDGICDVWRARYGATGLAPEVDTDGDGASNAEEARAGTDPFDASDAFRVGGIDLEAGVDLETESQAGKQYRMYAAASLGGPWQPVGPPMVAAGGQMVLTDPTAAGGHRFYRIAVKDVDRDGDGVSDWAEGQLGLDPANADSAGTGQPGGDGVVAANWVGAVGGGGFSVAAVAGDAYEKENSVARFTLTRPAGSGPFAVFLRALPPSRPGAGVASPDDYRLEDGTGQVVAGRVLIPAGQTSMDLVIRPTADALAEVPEEVRWAVGGSGQVVAARVCDARPVADNLRLFVAYLRPLPGVASLGSGLASIRLAGDHSLGTLAVTFSNLKATASAAQMLADGGGTLVSVPPSLYGGLTWPVAASQHYPNDQAVLDALLAGELSFRVFTSAATGGEIGANFNLVAGSTEFQVPPAPPPVVALAGEALDREIARFLTQATFGPTIGEIAAMRARVQAHGGDRIAAFGAWIDEQLALPSPSHEALTRAGNTEEIAVYSDASKSYHDPARDPNQTNRRGAWWTIAMASPDQLRQRMAHALGQIFVVSEEDDQIYERAYGLSNYQDMLKDGGTGSFRQLLEGVSLHPIMGHYLSHLRNQKALVDGSGNVLVSPDENFAREIMQLFSIGLVRLHPDGTLVLGPDGLPIPTYNQNDITELARVFTGWSFSVYNNPSASDTVVPNENFNRSAGTERFEARWTHPMKMFGAYHDTGAKSFLGLVVPAGQTGEVDLAMALDHLAAHPNTAPFLSRQIIQRFTTSNPSPGYTHRVAGVFLASGGNLGQTLKAVLLDPEARDASLALAASGAGKPREPLLRHAGLLRALGAKSELPLSDLADHGYPAQELGKFPAGTRRARFSRTTSELVQMPMAAPSVFNWYRPDFAPPGLLAENGLSAPELQIANETTIVRAINYHYAPVYGSTGQSTTSLPNFADNGYTANADHMIADWTPLNELYLSETDRNGDGIFNNLDTATFNNPAAIRAAVTKVVDRLDLLLCAGSLKAKYGDTPGSPRAILIDGVISIRSTSNTSNTGQATSMNERIKAAVYLIVKNPAFAVQK